MGLLPLPLTPSTTGFCWWWNWGGCVNWRNLTYQFTCPDIDIPYWTPSYLWKHNLPSKLSVACVCVLHQIHSSQVLSLHLHKTGPGMRAASEKEQKVYTWYPDKLKFGEHAKIQWSTMMKNCDMKTIGGKTNEAINNSCSDWLPPTITQCPEAETIPSCDVSWHDVEKKWCSGLLFKMTTWLFKN